MVTVKDYAESVSIAWCPGCGNFAILQALRRALVDIGIEPHQLLLVSGIGQAPKLPHYTRGNVFNGLHGRTLSAATGARIANHELTVIGIDGDGGAYGEGIGHLLATMRRNVNITYIVHNNQVYGLTKGQASPTSDLGFVTRTTPLGASQPVNPLALALASEVSFLARGFAGDVEHHAVVANDAGVPVVGFDVGRRPPGGVLGLGIPGLERLLCITIVRVLPELAQCAFGDDAHRVLWLQYILFWEFCQYPRYPFWYST